jgi:hypothetical protein
VITQDEEAHAPAASPHHSITFFPISYARAPIRYVGFFY